MKYGRGITHLEEVASECDLLNERLAMMKVSTPLASLWAYDAMLRGAEAWDPSLNFMRAAVSFDLPAEDVWWLGLPAQLEFATGLCGWQKRPLHLMYRSAQAPVWNHYIERPVLVWSIKDGIQTDAIEALRSGDPDQILAFRAEAPSRAELLQRLLDEQAISLAGMRRTTDAWDADRWGRGNPRKRAEPMWEAAAGYVEVSDAIAALGS